MGRWLWGLSPDEKSKWFNLVVDDLANHDGGIFGSHIIKTVPLAHWRTALSESQRDASLGKYLVDVQSKVEEEKISLNYFRGYGRAEAIRMLLAHA